YCKLPVLASRRNESLDHRLATRARIQISAVRLKDSPLNSIKVNLRPALPHLGHRKFLKLDFRPAQHFHGRALEGVVVPRSHPQHAAAVKKLPLPPRLVLLPELKRSGSHLRIRLIGPVSPT